MYSGLGVVLGWSGRNDEAAEQERKAIALDPFFPQPHLVLASAYDQLGRYDEAVVEHLKTDTLEGIDPLAVAGFKPEELEITAKEGTLIVSGKAKQESAQPRSLSVGCPSKAVRP